MTVFFLASRHLFLCQKAGHTSIASITWKIWAHPLAQTACCQHTLPKLKTVLFIHTLRSSEVQQSRFVFFISSASWTSQHCFIFCTKVPLTHKCRSVNRKFSSAFRKPFPTVFCLRQSLGWSAGQPEPCFKKIRGATVDRLLSISMHETLDILLSPVYCINNFGRWLRIEQ